ncbi:MAG: hypothetical protein ACI36V_01720 [Coriobacteriales bacterium]
MYESITKHLPSFKGMRRKEEMHLQMRTSMVMGDDGKMHEIISFGADEYPEPIEDFVRDVRSFTADMGNPHEVLARNGYAELADVRPAAAGAEAALAALALVVGEESYSSGALSDDLISGFARGLVERLEVLDR